MTTNLPSPPPSENFDNKGKNNGISYGNISIASPGVRLGAFLLDCVFAVITLGIGWIIWSLVVWGKGTTPGHQVLKVYIVDAKTNQFCSWGHKIGRAHV